MYAFVIKMEIMFFFLRKRNYISNTSSFQFTNIECSSKYCVLDFDYKTSYIIFYLFKSQADLFLLYTGDD